MLDEAAIYLSPIWPLRTQEIFQEIETSLHLMGLRCLRSINSVILITDFELIYIHFLKKSEFWLLKIYKFSLLSEE
jgi:hypothetical protein